MSNPLGPPPGQSKPVSPRTGLHLGAGPLRPGGALGHNARRGPAGRAATDRLGDRHLGRGRRLQGDEPPEPDPELIGLTDLFVILAVTFASLLAAGMPILSALIGVGVRQHAVAVVSHVARSTAPHPNLAEMLGLAVGIDYSLFLLSRYRRQLAEPEISPVVAMSRALATAGSAVVFAGTTVIIALTGLAVARIPVLTVMGLGAAAAVAIAVCAALTLVPSIALLFGERLRPRARRTTAADAGRAGREARAAEGRSCAPAGCAWPPDSRS